MRTVVSGGWVIDGAGGEGPGTVVIDRDRIESVVFGKFEPSRVDARVIDGSGLVVAPGLIDMHSHDDVAATDARIYEAKIRQGVTTSLIGLDGVGYAPVDSSWQRALTTYWTPVDGDPAGFVSPDLRTYGQAFKGHLGLNVVLAVPFGNLRLRHGGWGLLPLKPDALAGLVADVEEGLDAGAYGLTTGLGYVPQLAADRWELRRVAAPLASRSKIYASHIRNYGMEIMPALDEALDLGRQLGIHVHLSHLHLSHPEMFGRAQELVQYLDRKRRDGLHLSFDVYPYSAGSSILHSYLPAWLLDGGPDAALERLGNPKVIERLQTDPEILGYDWHQVVITRTRTGNHVGRSVAEAANERKTTPSKFMAEILIQEQLEVGCVVHQTLEADDVVLAEDEGAVVGSDGIGYGQRPHPRYYGAFAAFFDRHVNQRRTMTMQAALAKMSTRSAEIVGLRDRGRLQAGAAADLFVFDPKRYQAQSTYESPRLCARGVEYVLVNGALVLDRGHFFSDLRPGRVLSIL